MLSKPLNILKTSIRSPRNLLVSRVVKPNFCNRSVYDKLLSLVQYHHKETPRWYWYTCN